MLQWIKSRPIPLIHQAVILVAIYFVIYRPSLVTGGLLLALSLRLILRYERHAIGSIFPILLVFSALFLFGKWQSYQVERSVPNSIKQIYVLPDTIRINGDQLMFRGTEKGRTYQAFYRLKREQEKQYFSQLTHPTRLQVTAQISQADGQRNFDGFDYQAYLKTQDIYGVADIEEIGAASSEWSWNPFLMLSSWRRKALVHIYKHFPTPMCHYMTGLLFGELGSDFSEMGDRYSSLGIIHLFALSGMQVGFFIDKLRWLLLRLGLKKETVNKMQIPLSFLYAGLTGFSPSVNRSLIQRLLGNVGFKRLDNLALTLMVCWLLTPHILLTTGGVLSFAYAFLLTVFDTERLSHCQKLAMECLCLSLGILPFLLFYFHSFQPLSILLTLVFSFIFDVLMLPALTLIFLLSPIVNITQVNFFFVWLEEVIRWVASIFSRPIVFGKPNLVIFLAMLLLLALVYDYYRSKKLLVGLVCGLCLLFWLTKSPPINEVTIVDIGQGDSIFLRDAKGKTMLIDVGGKANLVSKEKWQQRTSTSNAERTLIPYLYSRGISKIDCVVLTHTDIDHIGDLRVVAQAVEIGEICTSEGSLTDKKFVQTLRDINIPVRVVSAGHRFSIMGSSLQVLYPFEKGDGENNDSIVLYGKLLDKRFLFTGDLEDGELELIKRYPRLPVDVLKAGHHGSKGSSYPEFLTHIGADTALVSAGKNNQYKHPHPETLERFAKQGMMVYRTDQQGAIRYYGWKKWHVETVR